MVTTITIHYYFEADEQMPRESDYEYTVRVSGGDMDSAILLLGKALHDSVLILVFLNHLVPKSKKQLVIKYLHIKRYHRGFTMSSKLGAMSISVSLDRCGLHRVYVSKTDSCVCEAGWTGPQCNETMSQCGIVPQCLNRAECVGSTCSCRYGSTGVDCGVRGMTSIDVDQSSIW